MILTVCISPSVDVTIELDQLNIGKVNLVKSKTFSFTGKAINVAIGVSRLGAEAYARDRAEYLTFARTVLQLLEEDDSNDQN